MKTFLSLTVLVLLAHSVKAQETVGFDATLAPFGSGAATVLYLTGDQLSGNFSMSNMWLISVAFPATATDAATSYQVIGPIDSVFAPSCGFPGGASLTYQASFTLDDSQVQELYGGEARITLMQDLFSADPAFTPEIYQTNLIPTPEPATVSLLAAGSAFLLCRRKTCA